LQGGGGGVDLFGVHDGVGQIRQKKSPGKLGAKDVGAIIKGQDDLDLGR
jgi:hypothetical protein